MASKVGGVRGSVYDSLVVVVVAVKLVMKNLKCSNLRCNYIVQSEYMIAIREHKGVGYV